MYNTETRVSSEFLIYSETFFQLEGNYFTNFGNFCGLHMTFPE